MESQVTSDPYEVAPTVHEPFDLERGQGVPLALLIHRSRTLALIASGFIAYSAGFEFQLSAIRRSRPVTARGDILRGIFDLQLLIEAEGGRGLAIRPDDIAQGDGQWWSTRYVVLEAPPPGRLTLIVNWPARHLVATKAAFESEDLLAASRAVERLWPQPR
jgi:hypothetical protein